LVATNSFAANVANLYQSSLAVSSQSEVERQKVSPDVLRKVILKVVGDSAIVNSADLSTVLPQSNQLIQQYEYRRTNVVSEDLTQPDKLQVLLTFKEHLLNKALTNIGLPIWGRSRPETLIWLAVDKNGKRSILSADDQSSLLTVLKQAANDRGLPILFPVMDLQDQQQVTFTDLSAGFSQSVEHASQRYGSPIILMAVAKVGEGGIVSVNWHVRINEKSEQWQSRGNAKVAMQSGIDVLTDRLARRFSQHEMATEQHQLKLHISAIHNYADYVRVTKYLKALQYVSDVQVSNLAADTADITVIFDGNLPVFNRTLEIDRVLIAEPYSPTDELNYRLAS